MPTSAKVTVIAPVSDVAFPLAWRFTASVEPARSTSDTFFEFNGAYNCFLSSPCIWGTAIWNVPSYALVAGGRSPSAIPLTSSIGAKVALSPLASTETTLLYVGSTEGDLIYLMIVSFLIPTKFLPLIVDIPTKLISILSPELNPIGVTPVRTVSPAKAVFNPVDPLVPSAVTPWYTDLISSVPHFWIPVTALVYSDVPLTNISSPIWKLPSSESVLTINSVTCVEPIRNFFVVSTIAVAAEVFPVIL